MKYTYIDYEIDGTYHIGIGIFVYFIIDDYTHNIKLPDWFKSGTIFLSMKRFNLPSLQELSMTMYKLFIYFRSLGFQTDFQVNFVKYLGDSWSA